MLMRAEWRPPGDVPEPIAPPEWLPAPAEQPDREPIEIPKPPPEPREKPAPEVRGVMHGPMVSAACLRQDYGRALWSVHDTRYVQSVLGDRASRGIYSACVAEARIHAGGIDGDT